MIYYIVGLVLVITIAFFADVYARKHKLGHYAPRKLRRHANTGEIPVVEHKLDHELSYNTAEIPVITDVKTPLALPATTVAVQVQEGRDYIQKRYGDLPPVPSPSLRTDTVMAEAIDPSQYPEWAK